MKFFYLATAYSKHLLNYGFSQKPRLDMAYQMACVNMAFLIKAGIPVFSPIAATHGAAIWGDIDPLDYKIWKAADQPFVDAALGIIVLMSEGWRESVGIQFELEEFRKAKKPEFFMMELAWPGDKKADSHNKKLIKVLKSWLDSGHLMEDKSGYSI